MKSVLQNGILEENAFHAQMAFPRALRQIFDAPATTPAAVRA